MPQERLETLLNDDALDVGIAFDVRSPDIEGEALLSDSLALMIGKSHPYTKRRRAITLGAASRAFLRMLQAWDWGA